MVVEAVVLAVFLPAQPAQIFCPCSFDCVTDSRPLVLAVARPLLRPLRTLGPTAFLGVLPSVSSLAPCFAPSRRGRPAVPGPQSVGAFCPLQPSLRAPSPSVPPLPPGPGLGWIKKRRARSVGLPCGSKTMDCNKERGDVDATLFQGGEGLR